MKSKIILTFEPTAEVKKQLTQDFEMISCKGQSMTQLIQAANDQQAQALMISVGEPWTAENIQALPKTIKIIATCSVGYDHLDVHSLKERGIYATNTPDVLTDATADLAFLLLLGSFRKLKMATSLVSEGWGVKLGQADMLGLDLKGKRLGIYGMGRIGQAVAIRARAFGMEILYSNRHQLPADQENGARYFKTLHEMLPLCNVLSLHAPGNAETKNSIGEKEFALLPKNAVLINVARGSLVNEDALFAALDSEKLFAAGVDVCNNEPFPDPRFISNPKILMTPHIGSATQETRDAMGLRALNNIRVALSGQVPPDDLDVARNEFTIYGISVRTNNKTEFGKDGKIGKLWARYFADNIGGKIPDHDSEDIFAVYSNYASDFNGDYDYTIGLKSKTAKAIEGLTAVKVQGGKYLQLKTSKGPIYEVVPQLWQTVWKMSDKEIGGKRSYLSDYEVYGADATDPQSSVVKLYLGYK